MEFETASIPVYVPAPILYAGRDQYTANVPFVACLFEFPGCIRNEVNEIPGMEENRVYDCKCMRQQEDNEMGNKEKRILLFPAGLQVTGADYGTGDGKLIRLYAGENY